MAAERADLEHPLRAPEPDERLQEAAGDRAGQHRALAENGRRLGRELRQQRIVRRGEPLCVVLDARIDQVHAVRLTAPDHTRMKPRMPGLMSRMSLIVKSKFSKALDKAENPNETLDYSYEQQLQQLQNVKRGIADVTTAKKRLELQYTSMQQQVDKLDGQARDALKANREDLAREALSRKAAVQAQLGDIMAQGQQLEAQQQKLIEGEQTLAAEGRVLPHAEGGHQGAVQRRRGAGADQRGRDRDRRAHGRRRHGDRPREGQDGADAGARGRGRGADGSRRRSPTSPRAAATTSTAS